MKTLHLDSHLEYQAGKQKHTHSKFYCKTTFLQQGKQEESQCTGKLFSLSSKLLYQYENTTKVGKGHSKISLKGEINRERNQRNKERKPLQIWLEIVMIYTSYPESHVLHISRRFALSSILLNTVRQEYTRYFTVMEY